MLDVMNSGVFLAELGQFPGYARGRRHQLGAIELGARDLEAYNETLHQVCPAARTVQADQIASIGRRVLESALRGTPDGFIAGRMAGVPRLARMRVDRGWRLADGLDARIGALLAYVEEPADLIPDPVPVIGQLDDALLVDLLSRDIAGEVADYLDFCEYRRGIAERCRVDVALVDIGFDEWLAARCAAHEARRRPMLGAYASAGGYASFRVN